MILKRGSKGCYPEGSAKFCQLLALAAEDIVPWKASERKVLEQTSAG